MKRSNHHWSRNQLPGGSARASRRSQRRATSTPSTLSEGSLTAEEGCSKWYHVAAGDSCYSVIAAANPSLSLDGFYQLNPQVNEDCYNLWAGYDYCVDRGQSRSEIWCDCWCD